MPTHERTPDIYEETPFGNLTVATEEMTNDELESKLRELQREVGQKIPQWGEDGKVC